MKCTICHKLINHCPMFLFADIDECASEPCKNDGTCTDKYLSFECECIPGYIGPTCKTGKRKYCAHKRIIQTLPTEWELDLCVIEKTFEIDGIQEYIENLTSIDGFVVNIISVFYLVEHFVICVIPGIHLKSFILFVFILDIDECSSNPCKNGGTCSMPELNSFQCTCPTGYEGSATCDQCEYLPNTVKPTENDCLSWLLCLPSSIYIGDCSSVYLSVCSTKDGQPARPNGLKFGG